MDSFVFYASGGIAAVASLLVVTRRNPVYSAIFLVLFFTMISIQFLVLRAPFLAVIQVLVYAGAIVVLFLFVLMLLNLTPEELQEKVSRARKIQAGLGSLGLFALLALAISSSSTVQSADRLDSDVVPAAVASAGETREVADSLFRVHLLPFELTSFLIMIAIIAAIYLTKSRGSGAAGSAGIATAGESAAIQTDESVLSGKIPPEAEDSP